jgi:hypothetical protein
MPSTTGTPVHYGQIVRASAEPCSGEQVHRYTVGKESGHLPNTTGTPVHYGQTVRASAGGPALRVTNSVMSVAPGTRAALSGDTARSLFMSTSVNGTRGAVVVAGPGLRQQAWRRRRRQCCTGGSRANNQGPVPMSKQAGRRMRRVCAGTPVHYEQTVGEEDAARVCGYNSTLCANSQGGGCGECVRVHRYSMSKQAGPARHAEERRVAHSRAPGADTRSLFSST